MSIAVRSLLMKREAGLVNQLLSLYNDGESEMLKYLGPLAEIAAGRKLLKDLEAPSDTKTRRIG